MDFGLKDAHILVTGSSGGIGLATTKAFLDLGSKVTAHYNSNDATLQPLLKEYGPSRIQLKQANLRQEASVQELFSSTSESSFGPIQIAIINHGVWPSQDVPLKDMTLEQWNSTIDTNLTSSFLVTREYLKNIEKASDESKEKASIVFIGSTAGRFGEANHADYAVTKSAMMYGLTLSLKNEIVKIAPRGRVNTIAPGWVRTPMAEKALKDLAVVGMALATTPLKKVATAEDIARQIAVISSPTISGHVTGEVITVAGGMEGRLLNPPQQ